VTTTPCGGRRAHRERATAQRFGIPGTAGAGGGSMYEVQNRGGHAPLPVTTATVSAVHHLSSGAKGADSGLGEPVAEEQTAERGLDKGSMAERHHGTQASAWSEWLAHSEQLLSSSGVCIRAVGAMYELKKFTIFSRRK